jgi:hypothetical protein
MKEGMAIASQTIKAHHKKTARLVEQRAIAITNREEAHAQLRRQAKQARNTAHPDDVRFMNLSAAVKEKLRTQFYDGDKGIGCPKCRWLGSCAGGCLACVLAKGVLHELKQLVGCWSFDRNMMKSAVDKCLEDLREYSTDMTHLHDVAKPPLC